MGAKAHVDGTLKRASAAGQEQQDWDVTNFYCRYLILSATDSSLHFQLDTTKSAHDLWTTLETAYKSTSSIAAFHSFRKYFNFQFDSGSPVEKQIEEQGRIWQEPMSLVLSIKPAYNMLGLMHQSS